MTKPDAGEGAASPTPDRPWVPVELLPEVVADLAVEVEDLTAASDEHQARLDALASAFRTVVAAVNQETPSRWAWRYLTRQQAAELWAEIRDFVDWLTGRYQLASDYSIPACWYRHPLAVEELTATYSAWRDAYCHGDTPSTALSAWHDRWLWPSLERVARHAGWRECKESRNHQPAPVRAELTDNGFGLFVDDEIATRPTRPQADLPWGHTSA